MPSMSVADGRVRGAHGRAGRGRSTMHSAPQQRAPAVRLGSLTINLDERSIQFITGRLFLIF